MTSCFDAALCDCRQTIYDDAFIRQYIEDLLKKIRTQVVLKLIQPYTRIRIPFISRELNIPEADVEQLLVSLILDARISGYVDQVCSPHISCLSAGYECGSNNCQCSLSCSSGT